MFNFNGLLEWSFFLFSLSENTVDFIIRNEILQEVALTLKSVNCYNYALNFSNREGGYMDALCEGKGE